TGKAAGGTTLALEVTAQATHAGDIDSEVLLQLDTVACDAVDHAACHPVENHFRIPLRLLRAGQASLAVSLPLELSR
ncbi:MAG: hypothetical protein JST92_22580, partial [Deltaproteobacteria bacterium]|nr:hypothetical protein [Deltaproteobacteria bacterium]